MLFYALGYDARDPEVLAEASKIADKALDEPASVDREMAASAFGLAALNGDQAFYDKLMAALKNAKISGRILHGICSLCPSFDNPKLLQRTLDFADFSGRSFAGRAAADRERDAKSGRRKTGVGFRPVHWAAVQKAGGPFASAEVVGATGSFCDAHMRDQVADFLPLTRSNPRNEPTGSRSNASTTA